jgi:hypothetical protein
MGSVKSAKRGIFYVVGDIMITFSKMEVNLKRCCWLQLLLVRFLISTLAEY